MISIFFKYCISLCFSIVNYFSHRKRDVILVRLDRLGDYILWQECARQISDYFCDKKITLICSSGNVEIASESQIFDEIIPINTVARDWKKCLGLKADIVIQPTHSRNNRMELITRTVAAKKRIAIKSDCSNYTKRERDFWEKNYNQIIDLGEEETHEIEKNQGFVNALLQQTKTPQLADLSYMIDERKIEGEYVVINLGASDKSRCWPIERFASVMEHIYEKNEINCVLIGGKNEIEYSNEFCNRYKHNVEVLTGKTNIRELISVISYCRLLLTNDTSTVHIAAACGVNCICISPGTTYPRFATYNSNCFEKGVVVPISIYKYGECFGCDLENKGKKLECCRIAKDKEEPIKCINEVSVNDIINAIDEII